jgi:hypothetical protein
MKYLMGKGGVTRIIAKMGAQPAMEMTGMPMGPKPPSSDLESTAERVGKESVTTPAGTFACEHYRSTNDGKTVDVWIDQSVSPFGLVKSQTPEVTMTLQRVITGAASRITETPEVMQMPNMKDLLGAAGVQVPSGTGRQE